MAYCSKYKWRGHRYESGKCLCGEYKNLAEIPEQKLAQYLRKQTFNHFHSTSWPKYYLGPRGLILISVSVAVFIAIMPNLLSGLMNYNMSGISPAGKSLFILFPLVIVAVVLVSLLSDIGSND